MYWCTKENWDIIGLDNSLLSTQHQAIIYTNVDLWKIRLQSEFSKKQDTK